MSTRRRLFAGERLRSLRERRGLRQAELADTLNVSAPYLSQLENDQRPLTTALIERLAELFPLDWQDLGTDATEQLTVALREATADPLFASPVEPDLLVRIVEQQPALAERFVARGHSVSRRRVRHESSRIL